MPRVLHTAQALVDRVIEVPELPARAGNVNVTAQQRYAGGAATILVAAARTGADAVHGGAVGTGQNGDLIRSRLRQEGVTIASPPVADADTGECLVLLEPGGERTFLTIYGAEREVTTTSYASLDPRPGDLLCISGYSLFEPTREPLLEFLETLPRGVRVVLDPAEPFAAFARDLQDRVLSHVDVWTSNAFEARAFSRIIGGVEADEDVPELIRRRIGPHAVVVIRNGERGCAVFHHGRGTLIPGVPQTPVDTNGAGDTHTGVLLGERALGADWESAALRANAAAGIKVTRKGPASAPTRAEVDAFLG
jgi:sugar/nucleoside kinase (ribokinase family)